MAGFFPIFFEKFYSNPNDVIQSTYQLGLANSISSIFIALVSPLLGAIADRGSAKEEIIDHFCFSWIINDSCSLASSKGDWQLAVFFYIIATIGFMAGNIFYDSLLPSVAGREKVDYVSALGYSLGY